MLDAIPATALDLENQSVSKVGKRGKATLGRAYELLRGEWRPDVRRRELALHLAFLSWYLLVESPADTGLSEGRSVADLQTTLTEAHDFLLPSGEASDDAEALYVFGVMMQVDPYIYFENQKEWIARSTRYRTGYRRRYPNGIDPRVFEGRGASGHYFHGHAVLKNAY